MSEYSSKYIICPYCGHKRYPDIGGFDFEDESCEEDECEECEEVFILKPYSSTYNIKKEIPAECNISFDTIHFYQIFTNLIQNAFDAIAEV